MGLDERGRAQAKALGERIAALPLDAIVTSPLDRCQQTVDGIVAARDTAAAPVIDDRVGECRYGDWTGKPLKELEKDPIMGTLGKLLEQMGWQSSDPILLAASTHEGEEKEIAQVCAARPQARFRKPERAATESYAQRRSAIAPTPLAMATTDE